MAKQCPSCGNLSIVEADKFCQDDGTKLVTLAACSQCNTELLRHAKFCPRCGTPRVMPLEVQHG